MNRIAFICETNFVYWTPIVLCLAVLAAMCVYAGVYLAKGGKVYSLCLSLPLCVLLSFFLGRLVHWYCRSEVYSSIGTALTNYSQGDFSLVGAFAGCLLTAWLLKLTRVSDNMPKMVDSLTLAACVGIPVGRLSCMFSAADRGVVVPDNVGVPFAYPVINMVNGVEENRLATFMIQSLSTLLIGILLVIFITVCHYRKKKLKDGDIFLLFMTAYCCFQIICDSTRYDALNLRSNGFVSMVQIVALVGLLFSVVIFSIRMVKNNGLKYWQFILWTGILATLGGAGYMEYFVQNNSTRALFAYTMMTAILLVTIALTLVIYWLGQRVPKKLPETEELTV